MTLRAQLFLSLSALFFLVLSGLLVLTISTTAQYLEQQLGSHAQDAATSLSQTLAAPMASGDSVMTQTRIASLFDRGYFQRIVVLSPIGDPLVVRELPQKIEDVPVWFSNVVPLATPSGEAFVTSGWRQLGKIIVNSQATFAYQHLWLTTAKMAGWLAAAYAVALMLTYQLLRVILKPMAQIERTALAIRERHFEQIEEQPKAPELRRVVVAMNAMSRRISEFLDDETKRAEGFRKEAYEDALTALDNRRSFDLRFDHLLAGEVRFARGLLMVVEIDGLREFNREQGYPKGNALVSAIARGLRDVVAESRPALLCRMGGNMFGTVLIDMADDDIQAMCRALRIRLNNELSRTGAGRGVSFNIGGTFFREGEGRSQLLARADLATEVARRSSQNDFHVLPDDCAESASIGSFGWRNVIRNALSDNRWILMAQPVAALSDRRSIHLEVMARMIDAGGQLLPASQFLSMAERHDMMIDIDRALIGLVLERLKRVGSEGQRIAINVSARSTADGEFTAWLDRQLMESTALAESLSFEINEFWYARDPDAISRFAALLRQRGAGFGVDHFGLDPQSLQVMRQLVPDYVKVDGGLIRDLAGAKGSQAMLQSIVQLAHTLDVKVIAQCVESEEQLLRLIGDRVDGGQGYLFGAPEQWR